MAHHLSACAVSLNNIHPIDTPIPIFLKQHVIVGTEKERIINDDQFLIAAVPYAGRCGYCAQSVPGPQYSLRSKGSQNPSISRRSRLSFPSAAGLFGRRRDEQSVPGPQYSRRSRELRKASISARSRLAMPPGNTEFCGRGPFMEQRPLEAQVSLRSRASRKVSISGKSRLSMLPLDEYGFLGRGP